MAAAGVVVWGAPEEEEEEARTERRMRAVRASVAIPLCSLPPHFFLTDGGR